MKYKFKYPIEFTTLPDYSKHRDEPVEIIRQCTNDECDPECQPTYVIQASDGWIGHASWNELEPIIE